LMRGLPQDQGSGISPGLSPTSRAVRTSGAIASAPWAGAWEADTRCSWPSRPQH
jgi:hypothetical protein